VSEVRDDLLKARVQAGLWRDGLPGIAADSSRLRPFISNLAYFSFSVDPCWGAGHDPRWHQREQDR